MEYFWIGCVIVGAIILLRVIDQQLDELRDKVSELEDRLKQLEQ
jgi:hypothetical protein